MACKILIDHNTKDGFEAIAHARQYMLEMGKKELEDPEAVDWPVRGSHVLAPVSIKSSYNDLSRINSSVPMIMHALYFMQKALPSYVVSLNAFNVLHLSALLNILALAMKIYSILML